ncbi:hypothetical protein [Roseomonas alba]|nr:hypothetical protein [Neoroseomonas alba]
MRIPFLGAGDRRMADGGIVAPLPRAAQGRVRVLISRAAARG